VPSEFLFEVSEFFFWDILPTFLLDISVLLVLVDIPTEDMVLLDASDFKTVEQLRQLIKSVGVGHRATGLGLRIVGDEGIDLGEIPVAGLPHEEEQFVADLRVDHDTELASRRQQLGEFGNDFLGMRGVMHHSECPDEVEFASFGEDLGEFFGVGSIEASLKAKYFESLLGQLEALFGQVNGGQDGTSSGKIGAFGSQPATYFENPLA